MKTVIIESPYAGDIQRNVSYCRAAMRDSLLRGEAPYASHVLYTQENVLRDEIPSERKLGIEAGFAWRKHADYTVVYTDLGTSRGMSDGIKHAYAASHRVEFRSIPEWHFNGFTVGVKQDYDNLITINPERCIRLGSISAQKFFGTYNRYNGGIVFSTFLDAFHYNVDNELKDNDVYGLLVQEDDIMSQNHYDSVSSVPFRFLKNDAKFVKVPGI